MATLIPRVATIILSSDSIMPWEILSTPDSPWPTDAYAHTVFRNTLGAQLVDVDAEEVTDDRIRYIFRPDGSQSVADVPAGARFESFIELDEGPFKVRHGVVQRSEARFELLVAPSPPAGPRSFADDFQRAALGFTWEPLLGQCVIYSNPGLPNGVGCVPGAVFFFFAADNPGVIRYFRPLHTDNAAVSFTIVLPTVSGGSQGRIRAVFCADQRMTSGLAVEVSTETNQLQIARVLGPTTMVYMSTVSRTFVQGEKFTARYSNLTDTVSVYAGTSTSPVTAWTDTSHAVPHGNGYRYLHLSNDPTPGETGAQISGWTAQDEV